jgi:hypothetical protein
MQVAWHRGDQDLRPVADRWNDAANLLRQRGGDPNGFLPISENSLYGLRAELQRLMPTPVHDPARSAAIDELDRLCDRYRVAAVNVEQLQRWIEHSINDKIHVLLNDIPSGWDQRLKSELRHGIDYQNTTAGEVRAAITRFVPVVLAVEDMRSQLEDAVSAKDRTPPERLVWALYDRTERHTRMLTQQLKILSHRLDQIAGQIERISKSARYVRKEKRHAKERPAA